MMKWWGTAALLLVLVLAGCSSSGGNAEVAANASAEGDASASGTEESADGEQQGIEVDKNLTNVEITLPAAYFENQDIDAVIASAKEDGVAEATKNADGSVTYKMTKSVHKKMMAEMESGIKDALAEMTNGENFASIKNIEHNDSFSEFTLIVEREKYESSFDAFAALGIGIQSMFYQAFDGVKSDDLKATIHVQDESTGEVFKTIVYPDDMQNQ